MGSLSVILFTAILFISGQDYPLRKGKPTHRGIVLYIEREAGAVLREFQEFTGDSLYNVEILPASEDNDREGQAVELGHYFPFDVYISTAEVYEAYELADLKWRRRRALKECNLFVKAVILHELSHAYVYQTGQEMQDQDRLPVHPAYQPGIWIVNTGKTFGSVFIEEGVCEYICGKMGEILPPSDPRAPQNPGELLMEENRYRFQYKYAAAFLETFLDTTGLKEGIRMLLHHPPPTEEEILEPAMYFNRLLPLPE